MATPLDKLDAASLLERAVTEPGIISQAYSQFHDYSMGNMLLAWAQCYGRGIALGPIATYPKWKELGRYVKRGEKAIMLCMPVTIKTQGDGTTDDDKTFTKFIYRNNWFVLSQTEGQDMPAQVIPDWDKATALSALDVAEIPFDLIDGNTMGYAIRREVAISPLNPEPFKTLFHELAHVLLGHTAEGQQSDDDRTPRNLREAEAEAVALLCCEALSLPGAAESRGYIQSWYGAGNPIPEKSAQKVLKVANQIIKAGNAVKE